MLLSPRANKINLISHITFSVGWLGAVAAFMALAIAGLTSNNALLARSSYLAMEVCGWFVIVPFCFASLLTGLLQAVGTKWGLFKHYWIIVKLFLTIAGTILLLLHMKPISYLSEIATKSDFSLAGENALRMRIIADSGAAILLLITIITISIFKPWGIVKSGIQEKIIIMEKSEKSKKPVSFYLLIGLLTILAVIILVHLLNGGMKGH